ncbi:hypothetical protein [Yinghuangia soli]|uniref:Uncharacterized protein n=1 Tax=Yinghuangia soli TaxID=2908204 RepID=A0AA41PZB8_9ACTN|nr:hypothetical protein [Yinghuangia soli]MCF2528367.1 hypothetical protein [Yinghuangia soli]
MENPRAFLLASAPVSLQAAVLRRLGLPVRRSLLSWGAGADISRFIVEHGTSDERVDAAGDLFPAELTVALGRVADGKVAAALFENYWAPREALLPVLHLLPRESFFPPEGEHETTMLHGWRPRRALFALERDDPDLTREALNVLARHLDRRLGPPIVIRSLLGILNGAGLDAVRDVSAELPLLPPIPGLYSATVYEALADPTERRLAAAYAELCSSEALITRLRSGNCMDVELLVPRGPLDWAALAAAHEDAPFAPDTRRELGLQLGCPAELRPAPGPPTRPSYGRYGDERLELRHRLEPTEGRPMPFGRSSGIRAALGGRRAPLAGEVLHVKAMARFVLEYVQLTPEWADEGRRELGKLAAERLGADVEAWAVALTLLDDFTGTVPELLAAAAVVAAP